VTVAGLDDERSVHRRGERARNMNSHYGNKTKEVIVGFWGCHVPHSPLRDSRAEVEIAHRFLPPNLQVVLMLNM